MILAVLSTVIVLLSIYVVASMLRGATRAEVVLEIPVACVVLFALLMAVGECRSSSPDRSHATREYRHVRDHHGAGPR